MKQLQPSLRAQQFNEYICGTCTRQLRRQTRNYASISSTSSTSSSSKPEIYDVVCVGGGPAGLSLLAALRSNTTTSTLKTALIESQSLAPTRAFSPSAAHFSNRCSSLTPASVRFLEQIGAWKLLRGERVQAYKGMRVWDGVSGAKISFLPSDLTSENAGVGGAGGEGEIIAYMNENNNLTSALLKRIDNLGGVSIFDSQKVTDIRFGEDTEEGDFTQWPIVRLEGGKEVAARLLVGADGGNSPVRTFAGIESRGWDYGRVGVVATLVMEGEGWGLDGNGEGGGGKIAYQRFLPTGPVAMLPLPGKMSTLVWSTTPESAARLKGMREEDFVALVNAAFRLSPTDLQYLHALEDGQKEEVQWREKNTAFKREEIPQKVLAVQEGSVASFPLRFRHADTYIGERVALVGDAAHTTHPLAGQGLNQGQGDVESLVKAIEYSVLHGQDLGTQMSLESYNGERYAANHLLMGVVDKLNKLYGTENGLVVGVRSLGLRAVDGLGGLKGFFMRQASGMGKAL